MNVIIDTNLWISFLIGKKMSVMRNLFTKPDIRIYVCDELLNEFIDVSSRLKIRKYIADDDVQETIRLMDNYCFYAAAIQKAIATIRDEKDLYILSLAETVQADYILTRDKDLLSLQVYNQTKIVTCNEFNTIIEE
jgi:putative PIN family toxin of toxin-antitoxin system